MFNIQETMQKRAHVSIIFVALGCFAALQFGSCAGGAPPVSIPAPVSTLGMVVAEPDPSGLVLVAGAPGAAEPGATVLATNIGPSSRLWKNLFLKNAYAQVQAQTTAAPDGSFFLEIPAAIGDRIELIQEVNGERSNPVEVVVPCGGPNPPC